MNKANLRAFACYSKNDEIRAVSTYGGVFSEIATYFIEKKNARIYGAIFDEQFKVVHFCATSVEELTKLRGSKYPQSNLGNSFREIKADLNRNKNVVFVGTPCQVNALLSFLGTKPSKLFCIDFVCHGVASPGIWKKYLNELAEHNGQVISVCFKDKINGGTRWSTRISFETGTELLVRGTLHPFMRSYLWTANIRPSCYECRFKGLNRNSDITIADCWGIGEQNKMLNDNKGLSAVLLHSSYGNRVFDEIAGSIRYKEYKPEELMAGNWATIKSTPRSDIRELFFVECKKNGVLKTLDKLFKPTLKERIRYWIKD